MQGALYRRKAAGTHGKGAVALVLGAGNQTPVSALDVLHKLVLDDSVVICKMNPVNEWLGPYLRYVPGPWLRASTTVKPGERECTTHAHFARLRMSGC